MSLFLLSLKPIDLVVWILDKDDWFLFLPFSPVIKLACVQAVKSPVE